MSDKYASKLGHEVQSDRSSTRVYNNHHQQINLFSTDDTIHSAPLTQSKKHFNTEKNHNNAENQHSTTLVSNQNQDEQLKTAPGTKSTIPTNNKLNTNPPGGKPSFSLFG